MAIVIYLKIDTAAYSPLPPGDFHHAPSTMH